MCLFPENMELNQIMKIGILDLFRWYGKLYVQNMIVFSPETLPAKFKALKKKKKKQRQAQNRNKVTRVKSNTGCGNSLTSRWNSGTLIAAPFRSTLNDSAEFPRGSVLPSPPVPENSQWNNSTLSFEMRLDSLCTKYPQLEREIVKDVLIHQARTSEGAEEKLLDILFSNFQHVVEKLPSKLDSPQPYHNPDTQIIPGEIRYKPKEKRDKNTFVDVKPRSNRRKKKPLEDWEQLLSMFNRKFISHLH